MAKEPFLVTSPAAVAHVMYGQYNIIHICASSDCDCSTQLPLTPLSSVSCGCLCRQVEFLQAVERRAWPE